MDATTAEESFATILGNGSSWMSKKFNDFDFSFERHLFRVRCSAVALPDWGAAFTHEIPIGTYVLLRKDDLKRTKRGTLTQELLYTWTEDWNIFFQILYRQIQPKMFLLSLEDFEKIRIFPKFEGCGSKTVATTPISILKL